MSLYGQVWQAATEAVEALPIVVAKNLSVTPRDEPTFQPLLDKNPQIVVAPRKGLYEAISQLTMGTPGLAVLLFDFYVGLLVDDRPADNAQAEMRMMFREEVRLRFWYPRCLGLLAIGECHIEYDPMPGGTAIDPIETESSWQRFTVHVRTSRSAPVV